MPRVGLNPYRISRPFGYLASLRSQTSSKDFSTLPVVAPQPYRISTDCRYFDSLQELSTRWTFYFASLVKNLNESCGSTPCFLTLCFQNIWQPSKTAPHTVLALKFLRHTILSHTRPVTKCWRRESAQVTKLAKLAKYLLPQLGDKHSW